jgi:RNA polymerase sigma-70 factor (ECF subfamily)
VDDLELLERWRGGDVSAGNELFERHFESVHRFFVNKAAADAPDLVQRTFLACVEARDRFREQASFRTFLFAIAHHELLAHWRKRSRVQLDPSVSSLHDLDPSPSTLLARMAEERHLLEALRSIPLDLQVALELFYWEGLSGPELASVLEVPEGTVRSRIRRGLSLLRERLAELEQRPTRLATTLANLDGWARSIGQALLELPAE